MTMTATLTKKQATIDDLYQVEGKAEIVNGEIREFMPMGEDPAVAAFRIAVSLHLYAMAQGLPGVVVSDNAGFHVNLPNRKSFSPDAAYYERPPAKMKFITGSPKFAVEVRSEGDYGPVAEADMEDKRRDYFSAGTLVVWDVDLLHEPVVRKYSSPNANLPTVTFRRGDLADAEPAVPGWSMSVDGFFR